MFSGLTNQVTSWMGSVKGEGEEGQQQPAAGDEAANEPAAAAAVAFEAAGQENVAADAGADPDASRYVHYRLHTI